MKNQNNKSCSVTVAEQSCCHAIRDARVASCDTAIDTSLAVSDSTSLLMQQSISIVDGAAQAALRREPFLDVVKHSRSEKIARFVDCSKNQLRRHIAALRSRLRSRCRSCPVAWGSERCVECASETCCASTSKLRLVPRTIDDSERASYRCDIRFVARSPRS